MAILSTRNEVIAHLVSQGKPENFARAMCNEFLAGGPNGDDRIYTSESGEPTVATMDAPVALKYYDDFMSYDVHATDRGIMFDGMLTFDLDGNYLPDDQRES